MCRQADACILSECADLGLQLDCEVAEDMRQALMRLLSRHSLEDSEAIAPFSCLRDCASVPSSSSVACGDCSSSVAGNQSRTYRHLMS